ncbi:hypothetical protein SPI_06997 [Niveomyces insectorum RCEF 264]|uniref:Extracellular mutant protein 11 C-terminal domain-containing protein n=1 Tax=Niveomyces insectorum RCEF 264 TaxID=1081102 RepID=A0A167QYZ3_9HYPO|nr:hypothetical protein SPI_06997 [Niveomyces insectorum RCEF 264]
MPATQLKMLRYMRSSEPKGNNSNGNGNSNSNSNSTNGGPGGSPKIPPSPQSGIPHPSHPPPPPPPPPTQPQPQPQSQLPAALSARQQLAEAAKIPVPLFLRGTTPNHQANSAIPVVSHSPKQLQQPQQSQQQQQQQSQEQPRRQLSFQRARSNSDNNRPTLASPEQAQQQQQIWEESSINSMFTDNVTTTARGPRANAGRYDSPFPQQRPQLHFERTAGDRNTDEPTAPLLLGDRGVLRILPTGNAAADAAAHADDPYVERSPYGSPSRHVPVLKHSKYALRDARGATRRSSFSERLPLGNHEENGNGVNGSPEGRIHRRNGSITKMNGAVVLGNGTGMAEQDLGAQRSAYFRDVEAALGRTPGRPENDDDGSDLPSQGDEATNQRTPRQARSPPRPPPQQPPPALPLKRGLQESSLPRVGASGGGGGSRREKKTSSSSSSRKRRHSPDYDDSMLHGMPYTALRDEPFDHDPARMAVQAAATPPPQRSLEDRLAHFKTKDANSQHHFFTEMPVAEWDDCGDWFLARFAELSNQIRAKRQAKRARMAAFEAEIGEREKTVRLKAESIERTLGDLKHEGEGMMRGKVVDL